MIFYEIIDEDDFMLITDIEWNKINIGFKTQYGLYFKITNKYLLFVNEVSQDNNINDILNNTGLIKNKNFDFAYDEKIIQQF